MFEIMAIDYPFDVEWNNILYRRCYCAYFHVWGLYQMLIIFTSKILSWSSFCFARSAATTLILRKFEIHKNLNSFLENEFNFSVQIDPVKLKIAEIRSKIWRTNHLEFPGFERIIFVDQAKKIEYFNVHDVFFFRYFHKNEQHFQLYFKNHLRPPQ